MGKKRGANGVWEGKSNGKRPLERTLHKLEGKSDGETTRKTYA